MAKAATKTSERKTLRKPTAANGNSAPAKAAAKPSLPTHSFTSDWTGSSDVTRLRPSRTKIDHNRFGTLLDAPLTERDQRALAALQSQFGRKPFVRSNVDAGILRRLGERGFVEHVAGGDNEATATFRLTNRKVA